MSKRILFVFLVWSLMLTAFGCVPEEKPAKPMESQSVESIPGSENTELETTVTFEDGKAEERDDTEQLQSSTEFVTENTYYDITHEDTEATDTDKMDPIDTIPPETESESADLEPPRDEDETERDEG